MTTILSTLCTLAANVRGRNELSRIKALERIPGSGPRFPDPDARQKSGKL